MANEIPCSHILSLSLSLSLWPLFSLNFSCSSLSLETPYPLLFLSTLRSTVFLNNWLIFLSKVFTSVIHPKMSIDVQQFKFGIVMIPSDRQAKHRVVSRSRQCKIPTNNYRQCSHRFIIQRINFISLYSSRPMTQRS